jgi:hypothetical protein
VSDLFSVQNYYQRGATIRNIIRDNMLVNPSGLEGHAMPMDLNIEHLIGDLKVCEEQTPLRLVFI